MILVMTLIGVPLLGMVVYNYRLVEMSNSIKRSEYENEMAMDIISRIIRENVIAAISHAKERATEGVNELAELQKTNYSSSHSKYTNLWLNAYSNWAAGGDLTTLEEEMLEGFLHKLNEDRGGTEIKAYWRSLSETTQNDIQNTYMNLYVGDAVKDELAGINTTGQVDRGDGVLEDVLTDEENIAIEILVNSEGVIDEDKLNDAYNMIFGNRYQSYIMGAIESEILDKEKYTSIIEDTKIDVSGKTIAKLLEVEEDEIISGESYLKIDKPIVRSAGANLEIDTSTRFKKNQVTPSTTLSATFIIRTPGFDTVASVTQTAVPLSNAILNQGGITVGKQMVLDDVTVRLNSNLTVLGDKNDEDAMTAILIKEGSKLIAEIGEDNIPTNARIASAKDIVLRAGAELRTGRNPIYYRNLYVGDSESKNGDPINIKFNGDAVAEDDLEINYKGKVTVNQNETSNYYGFNDTNNKGPDSSSSIVINERHDGADISDYDSKFINEYIRISLGNLYLAGRAFIEDVFEKDHIDDEKYIYKTGESVAIKGNYIAYMAPLYGTGEKILTKDKVEFGKYVFKRKDDSEMKYTSFDLVDKYKNDPIKNNFDVTGKWKYFKQYAEDDKNYGTYKFIKMRSNVKYIQGTAFDKDGNVIGPSDTMMDTSFKQNLGNQYKKYTQHFGYMPAGEEDSETSIFGTNGWIENISGTEETTDGEYYQCFTNGSKTITLSANKKGIIVCKGDLTINLSKDVTFEGVIIVGGNLKVNGNGHTLTFEDGKELVVNTVIEDYLAGGDLLSKFTYDGSGSSYIVTEIGDELVNINDLIGITNWKKSNYGRL